MGEGEKNLHDEPRRREGSAALLLVFVTASRMMSA